MSFGIGAFPFGIFATAFNINDGRPPPGKEHRNVSGDPVKEKYTPPPRQFWLLRDNVPVQNKARKELELIGSANFASCISEDLV